MSDDAARVEALAEQAVERISGRRPFTITKFSRHPEGYFHAHVTPAGGTHIYVHCKSGSWMAPGEMHGKPVLKEVLADVAAELQRKARAITSAEKRAAAKPADDVADGGSEPVAPDLRT